MSVLNIRQLSKSFREGERVHRVLAEAQASIAGGATVAITGRSGSGKSTLLNLISGIDRPEGGTIEIDGTEVSSLAEPARTLYRRAHVGFIYQFFNLIPTLDVLENVRLVLELNGVRGAQARARSRAALAEVGLADRATSAVDQLSGGEQQRVAIARAVVHHPRLLLADEPTGNLDSTNSARIMEILTGIQKTRGMTLIVITHEDEIANSAPRHIRIHDGRIVP